MEDLTLLNQITEINEKKELKQFLLQINRIKLKDYLNGGLIVSDRYLDDCETDIQSKNKNFLVLSDGYIGELDEQQILLELILTEDEISKLYQVEDIFYFDTPLPISRIKKVYVKNNDIKKHLLVSIQNSENGVLPKELFEVYSKGKKIIFDKRNYKPLSDEFEAINYIEKIRKYDKRMGMFSFMKNASLYYADTENVASSYSMNYFTALSNLLENSLVNDSYHDLDVLKNYPTFKDVLYSENQITKEFLIDFSQSIKDNEIKELFEEYLKPTGTRDTIKEFAQRGLNIYYLIGLVWYFRQRDDNNKLENFKTDINDLIPYDKAEMSLAILGIYYGYSRLRTYEKIEIKNTVFRQIFGNKFNIKFEMKSKLDYISVESLYQKSFYDKKGAGFEYLEYPNYKEKIKPITDKKSKLWYKIEKPKYFDVENIILKKLSTLEMFGNLLGKFSDQIFKSKQSGYLINFVQYNFWDLLRVNEKGLKYFSKQELLEKLEASDEIIQNELIDVLYIGKNLK